MINFDDNAKRRIRFSIRRGLLELDIMLGRFMKTEFDLLDNDEVSLFCEILEWEDQDFLAIVNGKQEPTDVKYNDLIERLRKA